MVSLANKALVITGASRGIGREFAKIALKESAFVTVSARDTSKMAELFSDFPEDRVHIVAADISHPDQAKQLIDAAIHRWKRIDVLVNNAGVSMRGNFIDLQSDVVEKVFQTNTFGTAYTTMYALPKIIKSEGSVIFVNTISGVVGFPGSSIYSSSKMALSAIAQAIDAELYQNSVHIGSVYLPYVTNDREKVIIDSDGNEIHHQRKAKISQYQAALLIRKSILRRKRRIIFGFLGKFAWFINGVAPFIADFILRTSRGSIHRITKSKTS